MRLTSFTQDPNGNDILRVDARNWPTTYTVDALNRVAAKLYIDSTRVTNTWDQANQQITSVDVTGGYTFVWDLDGRKTAVQNPTGINLSATLDALGNRLVLQDNFGSTSYAWDIQSRLTGIWNPLNERTSITWDPLDREQYRILANGMSISHTRDANGRETVIQNIGPTGVMLAAFSNTYSPVDNRLTVLELDGTRATFSYDPASQIISEARGGTMAYARSYVWDPVGNRSQQYDSGVLTQGTFDAANQQTLITPASGPATTQTHDANGNLILSVTGSASTTQSWSAEDKLIGLVSPTLNESYLCSDDGLRKQETTAAGTTLFTYDGPLVLLETNTSGVLQARNTDYPEEFGGLASQYRGGASSFYGLDSTGSIRILVSSAGVVTDALSFKAFGEPIQTGSGTANPHTYVGLFRYRVQSDGSYLLSVRLLDPETGRFTSVDPIGGIVTGRSDYEYADNIPTSRFDPTGLQTGIALPPFGAAGALQSPTATAPRCMCPQQQWNPLTGPEPPVQTDPITGLPMLPGFCGPPKSIYGPPQPLPSYGPGMYIIPGCKEIGNVRAGLQAACTAIASPRGQACIAKLSAGFRNCINAWCLSPHQNIYCGSPACAGEKAAGRCTRAITDPTTGDITICTSIIGDPKCWNPGVTNVVVQIGKTLVHEAMHTCGMGDSARDTGKDPNNPAEDVARCIFGLPGHAKGY